jgi:Family of unknown function (DUF6194)
VTAAVADRLDPEDILRDVLRLDAGLRVEPYYSERAVFYNPGDVAPLGTVLCAIKDHDGPNDRASLLSRPGVYRFAFGMTPGAYERRFGTPPRRPRKGEPLALPGHDLTRLDALTPHPVYAWMRWVQILSPTPARFAELRPLLGEFLDTVRLKWRRRDASVKI